MDIFDSNGPPEYMEAADDGSLSSLDVISPFLEDSSMDPNEVLQHMKGERNHSPPKETMGGTLSAVKEDRLSPAAQRDSYMEELARQLAWVAQNYSGKQNDNRIAFDIHELLLGRVAYYNGMLYWRESQVFDQITEEKLKHRIFEIAFAFLRNGIGSRFLNEVVNVIKVDPRFAPEKTDDNASLIRFLNGTYDIETRQLVATDSRLFTTVYVPVCFPTTVEGTPVFDRFIFDATGGNPILMERILEAIGYLIAPGDLSAKAFIYLCGSSDTGKTVLASLISSMFNSSSVAHLALDRFQGHFSTSSLKNKYLNVCADLPSTPLHRDAIATLKQVTGADMISIEGKYQPVESYKPTVKLLFCSNFQLAIRNPDPALMRRIVTIPFNYPVPRERQDCHLLDKLLDERPAIIVKAMDAYLRLRANNYIFAGQDYIDSMLSVVGGTNLLKSFLEMRCVFSPEAYTFTEDLLNAYVDFCAEQGTDPSVTKKQFSQDLALICGGKIRHQKRNIHGRSLHGIWGLGIKY